jgi:hypothetical protein
VAIFHYTIGQRVGRGGGQSSLRSAAYLSRERYRDERTGWTHDFTPKSPTMEASDHIARVGRHAEGSRQEVLFLGLYAPEDAPDWCRGTENIERLWNAAEAAEKRKDAQIAERVIIALPKELTLEQSRWALQDHIREFTCQGRVVQVAIHSPENDQRNLHAHMQISLRGVDEGGFKAEKAREQQERYSTAANTPSTYGRIGRASPTGISSGTGTRPASITAPINVREAAEREMAARRALADRARAELSEIDAEL